VPLTRETATRLRELPKGDAIAGRGSPASRRRTGELVPLAHPLLLDHVDVSIEIAPYGVGAQPDRRHRSHRRRDGGTRWRGAGAALALRHGEGGGAGRGDPRSTARDQERGKERRVEARAKWESGE
jgi:hypothetical protein